MSVAIYQRPTHPGPMTRAGANHRPTPHQEAHSPKHASPTGLCGVSGEQGPVQGPLGAGRKTRREPGMARAWQDHGATKPVQKVCAERGLPTHMSQCLLRWPPLLPCLPPGHRPRQTKRHPHHQRRHPVPGWLPSSLLTGSQGVGRAINMVTFNDQGTHSGFRLCPMRQARTPASQELDSLTHTEAAGNGDQRSQTGQGALATSEENRAIV